jgi:hypothetical protein
MWLYCCDGDVMFAPRPLPSVGEGAEEQATRIGQGSGLRGPPRKSGRIGNPMYSAYVFFPLDPIRFVY